VAVLKRKVEGGCPGSFPPLAFFGSVVADRSRGRRPFEFLPGERLWVFGDRVADRSRGRWRWWASGEGLGGGYCTPPNRTRRERSELIFGGAGRLKRSFFAAVQQSYPQARLVI